MRPLRHVPRLFALASMLGLFAFVRPARPLPLFSRDLGESCDACHTKVPALNAAGVAFAQNGYRVPSQNGAPSLRPAASRELPVSWVGGTGLAVARPALRREADVHAIPGTGLRGDGVHAAGVVDGRFTYHANVGLAPHDDDPHVETAFVQLDDLAGKGTLNLRAGQFDAELPFLSRTRRETFASYLAPTTFDARGLELNGGRSGWAYAGGLSFSDRRLAGGPAPRRIAAPLEDSYFRFSRDEGRTAFGAQMLFDRQDSHLRTLTWLQHLRTECAASVSLSRLTVTPAWVFDRFDDRPAPGIHERHQYLLVETLARLDAGGRWSMAGRYEHDERTRNVIDPEDRRELEAVDLAWRAIPNAQVALEWANTGEAPFRRLQDQVDAFVRASW